MFTHYACTRLVEFDKPGYLSINLVVLKVSVVVVGFNHFGIAARNGIKYRNALIEESHKTRFFFLFFFFSPFRLFNGNPTCIVGCNFGQQSFFLFRLL